MCGIFGGVGSDSQVASEVIKLSRSARQRGRDSSGLIVWHREKYEVHRADFDIRKLVSKVPLAGASIIAGHSRLITNGISDNQPVLSGGIWVIHNGIVLNTALLWQALDDSPELEIDSEVIPAIASHHLGAGKKVDEIPEAVLSRCVGVVNCVMVIPHLGKMLLFSNNGSLFLGTKNGSYFFSSEEFPLQGIGCSAVAQVTKPVVLDIPQSDIPALVRNYEEIRLNLVPGLPQRLDEEKLLSIPDRDFQRCTKCVLPETMPYISFDPEGICNYCHAYLPRNTPRPLAELENLLEPYRRGGSSDCIVPFSGGRDSSFGLHVAVNSLGLKPIAYTYDWGMVTDLGRRNISRMCAALGVENIIVAADIERKRRHIRKNLEAWLKSPHLGMISILTGGDKHFFKYVEHVKAQTGINLNLWSINPLEVTHFKAGFLGIPPDFTERRVYSSGLRKQLRYQKLRFQAMLESPGYFNESIWDNLSGEYYRSGLRKDDYFHLYDYMRWDEQEINDTLQSYGWETAVDTSTTWRIGDGTAAFYNYVYARIAGFTEHDTFRSNQIREGEISRGEALELVNKENQPRYQNIRWYLDVLGLDFKDVIDRVNSINPVARRT